MTWKDRVRQSVFCTILAVASAAGTPMRADEVEDLMRSMNQVKIAHTLRKEADSGDD